MEGFEYDFQHFRLNPSPPARIIEIARHPRNETLLWGAEGGMPALAGVPTALCIAALPMAIHTQLEFPFYLSTMHFVVFLLLLAVADRLSARPVYRPRLPRLGGGLLCGGMAAMALVVAVLVGFALRGQQTLTEVERFGMEDVTPLATLPSFSRLLLEERIVFDQQVGALMRYNHTQDERLLDDYRHWAQGYLQQRIDKNVYASLIQVLHHQKQHEAAGRYRREAALLFPQDTRFASAAKTATGDRAG